jgi:hypothetical protein
VLSIFSRRDRTIGASGRHFALIARLPHLGFDKLGNEPHSAA